MPQSRCVSVLYVTLCGLSVTASYTSICKLRVHGLQFTTDSTTRNCITTSSMSLRTPLGLLQRSVPKIYSTGGQRKCSLFSQRILDQTATTVGKYSRSLPFVVNQIRQLLTKHSRNSVQPSNVRKPPELHSPFDGNPTCLYIP